MTKNSKNCMKKRTNDEQKRKNYNNKSYENKKRKVIENNNEKCDTQYKKNQICTIRGTNCIFKCSTRDITHVAKSLIQLTQYKYQI